MGVKVITPAAQQIPTVDLRVHCRTGSDEDALLIAFLAAAVGHAEHYTGRSFGQQVLELALDEFPTGPIELTQGPVASITSVTYADEDGVTQTLSNTLYTLDDYGLQAWAVPAYDTEWPSTQAVANAVKVRYVVGNLPAAVRAALLLTVGHLFENREASAPVALQELPMGVKALLDTVKVWSF